MNIAYLSLLPLHIYLLLPPLYLSRVIQQKSRILSGDRRNGVPGEALKVQVTNSLRLRFLLRHRRSRHLFSRFSHCCILLLASSSLHRPLSNRSFLLRKDLRPSDVIYPLRRWLRLNSGGRGDPRLCSRRTTRRNSL